MEQNEVIPGLAGVAAAKSEISYIDGEVGKLEYRGVDILELTEHSNFLESAFMLIYGELPNAQEFKKWNETIVRRQKLKFRIVDIMKNLPDSTHPMSVLQAMIAILGAFYTDANYSEDFEYDTITRLIAKTPVIMANWMRMRRGDEPIRAREELSFSENILLMLNGKTPDPEIAKILDKCLILHAEHTMNASTFATMVVGSTLADPYKVISAALGSLSGPLHGGANEEVVKALIQIGEPKNAKAYITQKLENNEKIMGFGHRVYKTYDPRAAELEKLLKRVVEIKGESKLYKIAKEVEAHALERLKQKGVYPNVDFYSGCIYHLLGVPTEFFTSIFSVARTAGWLAHWREYKADNKLFRPVQLYTGKREERYKFMVERG
ncbi:MAG TPA: citrate synthase [Campylobacterales bacterium]|nr:citrate synthase [Campylobacterales bacterium]